MESGDLKLDAIRRGIRGHLPQLRLKYGVRSCAVFGSFARGDAGPQSDIDLLVEFERPVGLFAFLALKEDLESLLHRSVDLVVREALKAQIRDRILSEAIDAA